MQTQTAPADVIVADDDIEDLYIFEMAMEKVPVRIVLRHAVNARELFILLQSLIPDILFLDVNMPGHDGIKCIAEIRADDRYDSMPVIMVSGVNSKKQVEEAYRTGANFFIEKSSDLNILASKLEKVFKQDWKQEMIYPGIGEFVL